MIFSLKKITTGREVTRLALRINYNVAPSPYWTYNGVSLQEIYDRTYAVET
jgi:hypothetical protein